MESALVTPLAPSLELVGSSDAGVSRLVFSGSLLKALTKWLPGLTIRPVSSGASATQAESPPRFCITLRGADAQLTLQLPWDIDPVSASVLGAASWPMSVQLACLCARVKVALPGLLEWLGQLGLDPAELISHASPGAAEAEATRFECWVAGHRIDASLTCRDAGWLARARQHPAGRGAASLASANHLAVPVCGVLGVRRLSLHLLGSLRVGDVLMLERVSGPQGPIENGMLIIGRRGRGALGWRCKVQGRLITATGENWMSNETLGMNAIKQEDAAPVGDRAERDAGRNAMADLEVDLHIELQVLSTPLGELAAMQPGYVLELPVLATEACVDLVVGGRMVGRAQLVCVGDRLGARILEVFHDDA